MNNSIRETAQLVVVLLMLAFPGIVTLVCLLIMWLGSSV